MLRTTKMPNNWIGSDVEVVLLNGEAVTGYINQKGKLGLDGQTKFLMRNALEMPGHFSFHFKDGSIVMVETDILDNVFLPFCYQFPSICFMSWLISLFV